MDVPTYRIWSPYGPCQLTGRNRQSACLGHSLSELREGKRVCRRRGVHAENHGEPSHLSYTEHREPAPPGSGFQPKPASWAAANRHTTRLLVAVMPGIVWRATSRSMHLALAVLTCKRALLRGEFRLHTTSLLWRACRQYRGRKPRR